MKRFKKSKVKREKLKPFNAGLLSNIIDSPLRIVMASQRSIFDFLILIFNLTNQNPLHGPTNNQQGSNDTC
jgi:hypothetical protein